MDDLPSGWRERAPKDGCLHFPPGLLGGEPCSLPILDLDDGILVLAKPHGIAPVANPWDGGAPALLAAYQQERARAKPELVRLGLDEGLGWVTGAEAHEAGLVLFARSPEAAAAGRDALGSGRIAHRYVLRVGLTGRPGRDRLGRPRRPAATRPAEERVACEQPVWADPETRRAGLGITGKRARTEFRWLALDDGVSWWEATTTYPRPGQLRLHAGAAGLLAPVPGPMEPARRERGFAAALVALEWTDADGGAVRSWACGWPKGDLPLPPAAVRGGLGVPAPRSAGRGP